MDAVAQVLKRLLIFSAPPSAQQKMKAAMVDLGYLSELESEQLTLKG